MNRIGKAPPQATDMPTGWWAIKRESSIEWCMWIIIIIIHLGYQKLMFINKNPRVKSKNDCEITGMEQRTP